MSLLLETIRVLNGKPENLKIHEERIRASQLAIDGLRRLDALVEIFQDYPPPKKGLIKARLIYNRDLFRIEFHPYSQSKITKLVLFEMDSIYYPFKFANREVFQNIRQQLPSGAEAIITIGGRITDTTYTNLAFRRGENWYTPEYPLLKGTKRAELINKGILIMEDIQIEDLRSFENIRLFNAMIPWHEAIELPIKSIVDAQN